MYIVIFKFYSDDDTCFLNYRIFNSLKDGCDFIKLLDSEHYVLQEFFSIKEDLYSYGLEHF